VDEGLYPNVATIVAHAREYALPRGVHVNVQEGERLKENVTMGRLIPAVRSQKQCGPRRGRRSKGRRPFFFCLGA
jgi:hypothetical protein